MICHFQGGGQAASRVRGSSRGNLKTGVRPPDALPATLPTTLPPMDPGPLGPLLAGLIGREVTLLAGGRLHAGRLLQGAPVTLVDAEGRITVLAAPVISVAF